MESKHRSFGSIILTIILVLIIAILAILFQGDSKKQAELENQILQLQKEKEFCNNLQINIGTSNKYGYLEETQSTVVSYSLCSNEDISAKQIITFTNGYKVEGIKKLEKDSCMIQQLIYASGYSGKIQCKDVESIELISNKCPQVKYELRNISKSRCLS